MVALLGAALSTFPGQSVSVPPAAVPVAASSAVTVAAAADAYVVAGQPTVQHGTEAKLTAANWTNWHSESYVRFVLPTDPEHRPVVGARVEFTSERADSQPTQAELHRLTGTWSETTSYADRPTMGAAVSALTLPGHDVAQYSFDVAAVVTGAGTYNFALANPTAQSVASVFAREHGADGPRLVVEYGTTLLCGISFRSEQSGETYQQALAREDGYFNGLESARVFYSGFPDSWPGKLDTAGRPMTVSFKIKPQDVLAGTYDTRLRDWFRAAPRDQEIYWTYWHEPEDDIQKGTFTAASFRQAWARIAGLAAEAGNPRLHATLILMGWSVEPASNRNWHDYFPGNAYVEVLAWDVYNPSYKDNVYKAPADLFAPEIAANAEVGLPLGIAETGSPLVAGDDGTGRAAWLRAMVQHLTAAGAVFVQYFDLDWTTADNEHIDYRLRDTASMAAWREFCG